jgi:hypothetical protein
MIISIILSHYGKLSLREETVLIPRHLSAHYLEIAFSGSSPAKRAALGFRARGIEFLSYAFGKVERYRPIYDGMGKGSDGTGSP